MLLLLFSAEEGGASGCAEKGPCLTLKFDLNKSAIKKSQGKPVGQPKGTTPRPTQSKSDSAGFTAPTGAAAPASKAAGSTPAPAAAAAPSAPAAPPASPVPGGTQRELQPESWRDSTAVQAVGGFVAGVALGLVPGGGVGAGVLSATTS